MNRIQVIFPSFLTALMSGQFEGTLSQKSDYTAYVKLFDYDHPNACITTKNNNVVMRTLQVFIASTESLGDSDTLIALYPPQPTDVDFIVNSGIKRILMMNVHWLKHNEEIQNRYAEAGIALVHMALTKKQIIDIEKANR